MKRSKKAAHDARKVEVQIHVRVAEVSKTTASKCEGDLDADDVQEGIAGSLESVWK